MAFAEDIRVLLVKRNLSQAELARKLEDSPQNLGQRLNKNSIKDKDLKEICDVLEVKAEIVYKDMTGKVIYRSEVE